VPDRRFASALVALGAILAAIEVDDQTTVLERFTDCPVDGYLTWIDSNDAVRFGRYQGIRDGVISYAPRTHGGWLGTVQRPIEFADSFWPSSEECEFIGAKPAAENLRFVRSALGEHSDRCLQRSSTDAVLVGTRTELERDLNAQEFKGAVACDPGALKDLIRPKGIVAQGQHHRTIVVPSSSDPGIVNLTNQRLAIFDGPSAYLRLRDSVSSVSNVVIIDRWSPRSTEAATAAMIDRNDTWLEESPTPLPPKPDAIELYHWMAEA